MTVLTYDEVTDALRDIGRGRVANPFPDWPAVGPREDVFPQMRAPVAVPAPEAPDLLHACILSWGYPVNWKSGTVFNTRIESLARDVGMWSRSAGNGRCLVPTLRFFERHGRETVRSWKTGRPVKRMYEFRLVDEPVTWLAGVCAGGHFSVVTTRPNADVAPVHDRMPLVLRQSEIPLWMEGDYGRLADRSDVRLVSSPERLEGPDAGEGTGSSPDIDQPRLF